MAPERARSLLSRIYGAETGEAVFRDLATLIEGYRGKITSPRRSGLSERDAILITYADQVREPGRPTLATLGDFCRERLKGLLSGIHILPFYPWSSDDGFSVTEYEEVAADYGTWDDVKTLGRQFRLMFDAVVNHVSAESRWFQRFLQDEPAFRDFFIEVHGNPDLSAVVRPRALPLLTEFDAPGRKRKLWTTFSTDQVDLNYHNPSVLLRIMDVVLFYANQGAELLRLDAIAYLWKELGTPCINLPQTHWIVQLIRAVLDEVAPQMMLITETNVPEAENLSYFGDGSNEAQLVYNFPLPPLVLHALHTGRALALSEWASGLELPSPNVTFLNFLASHDGIGLNPVRGILTEGEIEAMAARIEARGGYISKKTNADGTESPYEINANYFDALNAAEFEVAPAVQVDRFATAHAILLSFVGMPALYFHSLFGSRGWSEGVKQTGKYRSINREKLERAELEKELADAASLPARIFGRLSRLLEVRNGRAAFSPQAQQRIIGAPDSIFAILRENRSTGEVVLCVHSVSPRPEHIQLDSGDTHLEASSTLRELITDRRVPGGRHLVLELAPYETMWLTN